MTTQKELLEKALALKNEHPDSDIMICVDNSTVLDDSYSWTGHKIIRVEYEWIYESDEYCHVGLDDIIEFVQNEWDNDDVHTEDDEPTEEDAKKVAKQKILIHTSA